MSAPIAPSVPPVRQPRSPARKRVLLVVSPIWEGSAHKILHGIASFQRQHEPWDTIWDNEGLTRNEASWFEKTRLDGVISRHTNQLQVEHCRRLGIPLVDVNNARPFPGFAAGHAYEATRMLDLLRARAFAIRGLPVPPIEAPAPAPVLARERHGFTWRGSTGASHYAVERAPSPAGPWTTVADGLADSVHADVKSYEAGGDAAPPVLWSDETLPAAHTAHYRVRGFNAAGATGSSNTVPFTRPTPARAAP